MKRPRKREFLRGRAFLLSPEAWPENEITAHSLREDREIEKMLAEFGIEEA